MLLLYATLPCAIPLLCVGEPWQCVDGPKALTQVVSAHWVRRTLPVHEREPGSDLINLFNNQPTWWVMGDGDMQQSTNVGAHSGGGGGGVCGAKLQVEYFILQSRWSHVGWWFEDLEISERLWSHVGCKVGC